MTISQIPYEALPEQMANFIKEQSEIRGCPPDFILISILSRMGVLFAGKLAIALTRRTTWHAIPNFFWLMIGSPSSGKSNALSATEKPIKMLADIARATFKQQNKAYKAEMNMLTRQLNSALKGLDRENEKLAPDHDKVIGFRKRIQEIQQELYDLEDNKPTLKVYTVNKTTFEKLILTLKENQAGILLELDEVAPMFIRLSKDENCEERGLYLTGYNGNASYSYRTVSRDEDLIDKVVLSIIGGTQPSKIQRVVNEVKNDTSNDGFLQRFQGVVYPDKKVYLPQDKHGENLLEIELNNVIQNLDHLPLSDQIIFRFDDEAQIIFDEWREESTKQAYGLEPHLSAHVGKSYEFVAALSVYLYLYDNNGCVSSKPLITAEYVLRAIKLGAYFFSHAKRMYGLAYNNDIPARSLASKLTQLGSFFTRSQIRDKGWSNLIKKEERLEAITALIKRGYISEAIDGKFYINPKYLVDE